MKIQQQYKGQLMIWNLKTRFYDRGFIHRWNKWNPEDDKGGTGHGDESISDADPGL